MRYFYKLHSLKSCCSRKGFTLLELAIGLVAIGMMSAIVLQASSAGNANDPYAQTRIQLNDMQAALDRFAARNGYYPMPASTTPTSPATQGIAVASAGASGIIRVASPDVLIGNFPYATVGMAASYQSDPFKNGADSAFRYMISTQLTDATTYNAQNGKGVIRVVTDKNGATSTTTAAYGIVSHGEIAGCSAPGGGAIVNCGNTENIYNLPFNKGTPGINTGIAGSSNYFDDVLVYGETSKLDCSGLTATWDGSLDETATGPCTATILSTEKLAIGSSVSKSNTNSSNIGSAVITCGYNAVTQQPEVTALGTCNCKSGQTISWQAASGASCAATTNNVLQSSQTDSGAFNPITDEKVAVGTDAKYGEATVRCVNGQLTTLGSNPPTIEAPICVSNCLPQTVRWNSSGIDVTGQAECNADTPALLGASGVAGKPNTAALSYASGAGQISVVCNNGVLSQQSGTTASCTSIYPGVWKEGSCSIQACDKTGTVNEPICQTPAGITLADTDCNPALKPEYGQECTKACNGCATPWGNSVANGTNVTAYHPTTCDSQTLTCANNTLQGSKTGANVGAYKSATLPDSCTKNCDNGEKVAISDECPACVSAAVDVKRSYHLPTSSFNKTDAASIAQIDGLMFNYFSVLTDYSTWATKVPVQPKNGPFVATSYQGTRVAKGHFDNLNGNTRGGIIIRNPGLIAIGESRKISVMAHNWGSYGKSLSDIKQPGSFQSRTIQWNQDNWPYKITQISPNAQIITDGASYSIPAEIKRIASGPITLTIEFPSVWFYVDAYGSNDDDGAKRLMSTIVKPPSAIMVIPSDASCADGNSICPSDSISVRDQFGSIRNIHIFGDARSAANLKLIKQNISAFHFVPGHTSGPNGGNAGSSNALQFLNQAEINSYRSITDIYTDSINSPDPRGWQKTSRYGFLVVNDVAKKKMIRFYMTTDLPSCWVKYNWPIDNLNISALTAAPATNDACTLKCQRLGMIHDKNPADNMRCVSGEHPTPTYTLGYTFGKAAGWAGAGNQGQIFMNPTTQRCAPGSNYSSGVTQGGLRPYSSTDLRWDTNGSGNIGYQCSDNVSFEAYCYAPGQPQNNSKTDKVVACWCRATE